MTLVIACSPAPGVYALVCDAVSNINSNIIRMEKALRFPDGIAAFFGDEPSMAMLKAETLEGFLNATACQKGCEVVAFDAKGSLWHVRGGVVRRHSLDGSPFGGCMAYGAYRWEAEHRLILGHKPRDIVLDLHRLWAVDWEVGGFSIDTTGYIEDI